VAITSGRQPTDRQPVDRQPEGRQPGVPGTPVTPGDKFSEGTQVDDSGVVQVSVVANNYSPVATDVWILGTLHDENGYMYVTEGALVGTDYFLNGVLHTFDGVRYVTIDDGGGHSNGENFVSKGFVVDNDGRQYCVTTVSGNYDHGILRDADGSPCDMVVNSV
jgi:hypothetical protein